MKQPMQTRVVVVEDNQGNRKLLEALPRAGGYDVVIARDGVEGLELLELMKANEAYADIPVIILTADDTREALTAL